MLPLASDAQLSNLVDAIEEQLEASSDYLVATVALLATLSAKVAANAHG